MRICDGNEVMFNTLFGRPKSNKSVTEDEQRKGFKYGNTFVVGKTYEEHEKELKKLSITIDNSTRILNFLLGL